MHTLIIQMEDSYREYPLENPLYLDKQFLPCREPDAQYRFHREGALLVGDSWSQPLPPQGEGVVDGRRCYYINSSPQTYDIHKRNYLCFDADKNAHVQLSKGMPHFIWEPGRLCDLSEEGRLYLNGRRVLGRSIPLENGDCVFIDGVKLSFCSGRLQIDGCVQKATTRLESILTPKTGLDRFPDYKRSPRLILREPEDQVDLLKPPPMEKKKKGRLLKIILPPSIMICMTLLLLFILPTAFYAMIGAVGIGVSLVFSVTSYFGDKREAAAKAQRREEVYTHYLLRMRKKIYALYQQQREARIYHNPPLSEIERMINTYNSRIYERTATDDDFLQVSIGRADIPSSYTIKMQSSELDLEKDPLIQQARAIYRQFSVVQDMPLFIDLKRAHLGLVGEPAAIQEQLKLLLAQLTFQQSYHDLEIVLIYNEAYAQAFSWMRWYPHCKLHLLNVTGMIHDERVRDQVLGSLAQILKERKIKLDEQKKETLFQPHLLFVIQEPTLVINHSIMEYLQAKQLGLGFSIIYAASMKANLPENIKTILLLKDSDSGVLLMDEGTVKRQKVVLNHIQNADLEHMARRLCGIHHIQSVSAQLPSSITFFSLYNIKTPEELDLPSRWAQHDCYKSLSVPLGVRAQNDIVELNLHEKAHGPHGLVAGTTGSGKSEIVQSYILSLAVNFHPYEVGFLLIDYKGGGMASLFKNLPHLLGTITNLDGAESVRAMASIKSELSRRQELFNQHGVNHINQYQKLFKSGKADEPIPHLFLISDEFAELKKEQPDFMQELVSAARIGRSLGVHLILATQKPSGVVDDQIWTNSRFKLALKMANESDSNEILKTPDAASITVPGRAYLQVGNNEIYELFQSAWSGAPYKGAEEDASYDNRVYLLNELGQGQLVNRDLSSANDSNALHQTELDVTVQYIQKMYKQMRLPAVRRPWLPPLETHLVSPHLHPDQICDTAANPLDTRVAIGLVDIPSEQRQEEYLLHFTADGNLAVFGSAGFGKSTALTTVALSLAMKNSASRVRFYLLDLGNSSLIALKGLPQTADYLGVDDQEKLDKLLKILAQEMKRRKRLFARANAISYEMYNQIAGEPLSAWFIFIDNYDVLREINFELEDFISKLTRDGPGVGMYTVIAASRANAVKYAVLSNFKTKLALYLFDSSDTIAVVGRAKYPLGEIQGRALVKLDEVNQMQIYLAARCPNILTYSEKTRDLIDKIDRAYTGSRPKGIPVLPELLTDANFPAFLQGDRPSNAVPIGLDTETVAPCYLSLNSGVQLIVGGAQTGKTNMLKIIIRGLPDDAELLVCDTRSGELYPSHARAHTLYAADADALQPLLARIKQLAADRQAAFDREKQQDPAVLPRKFYSSLAPAALLIDDADHFIEWLKAAKDSAAEAAILQAVQSGVAVIATSHSAKLKGFDPLSKFLKESVDGILLGNPNDQMIYQLPHQRQQKFPIDIAHVYHHGDVTKIKVPHMQES